MKNYNVCFRSSETPLCWQVMVRAACPALAIINAAKAFEESMFNLRFDRIEIYEVTL